MLQKVRKSDSKDIVWKDFYFEYAVLLNFLFIKESLKSITGSKKKRKKERKIKQHNCFQQQVPGLCSTIYLSNVYPYTHGYPYIYHLSMSTHKSEWFLKDHVTLKTGAKADENSALHHRNKLYIYILLRYIYAQLLKFFFFWKKSLVLTKTAFFYLLKKQ